MVPSNDPLPTDGVCSFQRDLQVDQAYKRALRIMKSTICTSKRGLCSDDNNDDCFHSCPSTCETHRRAADGLDNDTVLYSRK